MRPPSPVEELIRHYLALGDTLREIVPPGPPFHPGTPYAREWVGRAISLLRVLETRIQEVASLCSRCVGDIYLQPCEKCGEGNLPAEQPGGPYFGLCSPGLAPKSKGTHLKKPTQEADFTYKNQTFRVYSREMSAPILPHMKYNFWVYTSLREGGLWLALSGHLSLEGKISDLMEMDPPGEVNPEELAQEAILHIHL